MGYSVQVLEEGPLRLPLGIEAERRVSPVFGLLEDAGGGADQRILGQASVKWQPSSMAALGEHGPAHPRTGSRRAVRAGQEPANRLRGGLVRDAETKADRVVREAGCTEPNGLGRDPLVDRWVRHLTERRLDREAHDGAQPLRAGPPFLPSSCKNR